MMSRVSGFSIQRAARQLRAKAQALRRRLAAVLSLLDAGSSQAGWSGFHPFPNTGERLFLRCWWLFNLGILVFVHVLSNKLGGLPSVLIAGVSDLPGITYYLSQFAFLLACGTIVHWRSCIPATFEFLFRSLVEGTEDSTRQRALATFLSEYRHWLDSRYRFILVGGYLLLAVVWASSVGWMLNPVPVVTLSRAEAVGAWSYYLAWFWAFLLPSTYFTAASAWAMGVTAIALNRATDRFGVRIRPHHPDGCAGLEPLSRLCFANAWPLVVSGMFLAVFGSGLFSPGFEVAAEHRVRTFARILFLWNSVLILVVFFLPLWKVHTKMVEQKRNEADKLSSRIEGVIAKTHAFMDQGRVEDAKKESENLAILRALHAEEYWPTWPINRSIKLKLLGSQVLSSLPMLLGAVPGLKEAATEQLTQLLRP